MTTTLTQTQDASFPVASPTNSDGLRVQLSPGDSGSHVAYVLDQQQPVLHTRVMFQPDTLAGGRVVLLAGFDDSGDEAFRVEFDASIRTITLQPMGADSVSAALPAAVVWHHVEAGFDTVLGEAALTINGIARGLVAGPFTAAGVRTLWLGAPLRDASASGAFALDEWVMADTPVGPPVLAPEYDHAGDPRRWLVVYNRSSDASCTFAQAYCDARNVPYANLCGLDLSTSETIDAAAFAGLTNAITAYLQDNALDDQVMGVLLGFGVPGYADLGNVLGSDSIASLLHTSATAAGVAYNFNATTEQPTRPTPATLGAQRLTARMDAPTLTDALALLDRAYGISTQDAGLGEAARVYTDPYPAPNATTTAFTTHTIGWATSIDAQRLRIPLTLSAIQAGNDEAAFDAVGNDDAFYWGWSSAVPPGDFFTQPGGLRVFAMDAHPEAGSITRRDAGAADWLTRALGAGYASGAAAVRSASSDGIPNALPFFDALRRGWTLAEAWYVSKFWLRDAYELVGDPLLTVALPRAGFEVVGPATSTTALHNAPAAAVLTDGQLHFALPHDLRPNDGGVGWYAVRQSDEQGRLSQTSNPFPVFRSQANAHGVAVSPAWPTEAGWQPRIEAGRAFFSAAWTHASELMRVSLVELVAEVASSDPAVIATPIAPQGVAYIEHEEGLPTQATRYAWRVTDVGGHVWESPWSAWVQPVTPQQYTLTLTGDA